MNTIATEWPYKETIHAVLDSIKDLCSVASVPMGLAEMELIRDIDIIRMAQSQFSCA